MVYRCCVPDCGLSNHSVPMHSFPIDGKLFDIWLSKVGRKDLTKKSMAQVRSAYRVCHKHFGPESAYIGSRHGSKIKIDAIPSLFLPPSIKIEPEDCKIDIDHKLLEPQLTDITITNNSATNSTLSSLISQSSNIVNSTPYTAVARPKIKVVDLTTLRNLSAGKPAPVQSNTLKTVVKSDTKNSSLDKTLNNSSKTVTLPYTTNISASTSIVTSPLDKSVTLLGSAGVQTVTTSQITNYSSELGNISEHVPLQLFATNSDNTGDDDSVIGKVPDLSVLVPKSNLPSAETITSDFDKSALPTPSASIETNFSSSQLHLNSPTKSLLKVESKRCLTCLEEVRIPIGLRSTVVAGTTVLDAIHEVTSKQYTNNISVFPKQLCLECFNSLKSALVFCRLVTASYKILQDNSLQSKNESSTAAAGGVKSLRETRSKDENLAISRSIVIENEENNDDIQIDDSICPNIEKDEDSTLPATILERKKLALMKSQLSKYLTFKTINVNKDDIIKVVFKKCQRCGMSVRKDQFKNHIQRHKRPLKTGIFPCSKCSLVFKTEKRVKRHESLHNGEGKDFRCKYCNKVLRTTFSLYNHIKFIHTHVSMVACSECGKEFKKQNRLDYHIKAFHTGERTYMCEQCGATFVKHRDLIAHCNVHMPRILCQICGRECSRSTINEHLREHRRKELGIKLSKKKYQCEICGKEMLACSRKKHLRTQHSIILPPDGKFARQIYGNARTLIEG